MDWQSLSRSTTFSVPDRLSIDLERLILDGTLAPGAKLPAERDLAEMLRVSRVSIRQALRELENRGFIDRKPGRGTIVLAPGDTAKEAASSLSRALKESDAHDDMASIIELRSILEPPIAKITANRVTARDLGQLEKLVLEMESGVPRKQYAELDKAFHQAIAQYTYNPLLALLNEQITILSAPSRAEVLQTKLRRTKSSAAHRRIYEAIAAGDGELAEQEARNHVLAISAEIERIEQKSR